MLLTLHVGWQRVSVQKADILNTACKLEEASTHKSAKTHAGNVYASRDLNLWPLDPKLNGFPGLIVKHF